MAVNITDGFSPGDDDKVISLLKEWKGGPLSDALFTILAKMIPQPCIETVVLRKNSALEVLLVPRSLQDDTWPGMLHSPGQALRAADYQRGDHKPLNGPFERIQKNEIGVSFTKEPKFVGIAQYTTKRGPEAVHVFLAEVANNTEVPDGAVWCDVKKLPGMNNFIQHQLVPIQMAVNYLLKK